MKNYLVKIEMERIVRFQNGDLTVLSSDCENVEYNGFEKHKMMACIDSFAAGCILINENVEALRFKSIEVADNNTGEIVRIVSFDQ